MKKHLLATLFALCALCGTATERNDTTATHSPTEPTVDTTDTTIIDKEFSKETVVERPKRVYYKNGTLEVSKSDTIFYQSLSGGITIAYYGKEAVDFAMKSKLKRDPKRWSWYEGRWAGFSLNFNGLIDNLGNWNVPAGAEWMKQSANSIGVDINFVDAVIYGYGCFGIVTGFGMEINNFRMAEPINFTNDPTTGALTPDYTKYGDAASGWKKTKLTTAYFQIPLLLEFKFGGNSWVNFGVVGSICYESYFKSKSDMYGVQKRWSGTNVPLFRYGYEFNLGISWVALKFKYYPKSIFAEGLGPDISQVNLGLSLVF